MNLIGQTLNRLTRPLLSQRLEVLTVNRWLGSTTRMNSPSDNNNNNKEGAEDNKDSHARSPPLNTTREYISKNPELQKLLSDLYQDYDEVPTESDDQRIKASISTHFDAYKDEDSRIIYDVDEERTIREEMEKSGISEAEQSQQAKAKLFEGIDLKRGKSGLFDVEDLVNILKKEKCRDTLAIKVAPELAYVDCLVVTTCTSKRHIRSVTEFLLKIMKQRMKKNLELPKVEGDPRNEKWIAMDLGNIALHLFTRETRNFYDIEQLWILGPEFDEKSREKDNQDKTADLFEEFKALKTLKNGVDKD